MEFQPALAVLALLLFLGALALVVGRQLRRSSGLTMHARVIYSDTGAWKRPERPLYSRGYMLAGKPDYIVEVGGARIPVEVKPGRTAAEPRASDVLQLAAYCLLIEEEYGAAPGYGLLRYRDATFEIEFDRELRDRLIGVLEEMRAGLDAPDMPRDHNEPGRCRGCGFRSVCGQALED